MEHIELNWIGFWEKIHSYRTENSREVVFITERVKPRVAKIAYALQKNGFKVILFLKKVSASELEKLDQRYFDRISFFSTSKEIYVKCLMHRPLVYHIFSEAHVSDWTEYLITQKEKLGKIVYDQYDAYRGFVTKKQDVYSKREKYCLENADGLCCRMFETQYLKKKFGYKFKGKRILFLDYCWNCFQKDCYQEDDRRHLRFIYGGRVLTVAPSNEYKIEFHGIEHITNILQVNKDYFVIVPTKSFHNKGFRSYKKLSKECDSLILKEPMSFHKLIAYESHMDYGIDCLELQEDLERHCKKEDDFNVFIKNKYYATNKYFDYLDAGIMPLYGRRQERFGRYLSYYGGALHCTLEEMPQKMQELRRNREENKAMARKAREALDITKQIERLIKFYKEL